jgi:hypothetical protein
LRIEDRLIAILDLQSSIIGPQSSYEFQSLPNAGRARQFPALAQESPEVDIAWRSSGQFAGQRPFESIEQSKP